jgi:hypothetical protein
MRNAAPTVWPLRGHVSAVQEFCYGAVDDHGYEFVEAWFKGVGCIEAP